MIDKTNIKLYLKHNGFNEAEKGIFKRYYERSACSISVNTNTEQICYPSGLTADRETTKNFFRGENFVVLDCVSRLLSLGYHPEDIVLEKHWSIGISKGKKKKRGNGDTGYGDVIVYDRYDKTDRTPLVIIECKTSETYDDEYENMREDGGQLFTYYQQENGAKYLCLYTIMTPESNYPEYKLINVRDDEKLISALKSPRTYKESNNATQRFLTWKETYNYHHEDAGLFEDNVIPYQIGIPQPTIDILRPIEDYREIQKIYNAFATILRKYNVSGHENAFDKLVNLFLAKIVDEEERTKAAKTIESFKRCYPDNPIPSDLISSAELNFFWKGIYDTDMMLQDRLLKLYQIGMQKFLNEEVTYVDDDDIVKAFSDFKTHVPAQDTVTEYFYKLKYFTNNDFSFIEVHNKHLFIQNSQILREIVQLLQLIKLRSETANNQFLGDLFEGFLDQGVKQSEGQFFTSLPIVRFIVSSLPLEKQIQTMESSIRAIDFACGAGHFLNEYASQIKPFISESERINYYQSIFGIEKEYRLSKVSKVSAFMYKQDEIQIRHSDALKQNIDGITNNSFNVLISNPPYSVKGFIETLPEEDRSAYELFKSVNNIKKNNSIETFFVERAAQLLTTDGVAAIILPSTILDKGGIFAKCREIILEKFQIIAISLFGPGTFGKTSTTTITLFLRRKDTKRNPVAFINNRIESWFSGNFESDNVYGDRIILEKYCALRGVSVDDYCSLVGPDSSNNISKFEEKIEFVKDYTNALDPYSSVKNGNLTGLNDEAKSIRIEIRAKVKRRSFIKQSTEAQQKDINKAKADFIIAIEREKLFYFYLALENKQNIIITKTPEDKNGIKKFLGYEWSDAKGNEGIKYLNVSSVSAEDEEDDTMQQVRGINNIDTPLFDPKNFDNDNKINKLIKNNYIGEPVIIPEALKSFVSIIPLVSMLDFSRVGFDKSINLSSLSASDNIESRYPMMRLNAVVDITRGVVYEKDDQIYDDTSENVILTADNITLDGHLDITKEVYLKNNIDIPIEKKLREGDSFMCFSSGSKLHVGKVCYIERDFPCFAGGFMGLLRPKDVNLLLPKYLFYLLNSDYIKGAVIKASTGSNINNLSNSIGRIKIPIPPRDIQLQIIQELDIVDNEYFSLKNKENELLSQIEDIISSIDATNCPCVKLGNKEIFSICIGSRVLTKDLSSSGTVPVYSANVIELFGKVKKSFFDDYSIPSVLWGIDGDWMVNYIPENQEFYPTDHCGVIRVISPVIIPHLLTYLLREAGKQVHFNRVKRASTDRVSSLMIPLLTLDRQMEIDNSILAIETELLAVRDKLTSIRQMCLEVLKRYF